MSDVVRDNLARVRARIQQACRRAGRDPASVTLVCVTKGVPVETIRRAVALGVTDLGENRVQEARDKCAALAGATVRWHLVGHLQRNKAKHAVELFGVIHSLDSLPLADELERQAAARRPPPSVGQVGGGALEVFVQVNVSGEATKFGCAPEQAAELAGHVVRQPHLALRGLMTLAPWAAPPEAARPHFRRLRELRDEVAAARGLHSSALSLSMGMSHDFEVAIEEGASLIRIGTAIFKSSESVSE